MVKPREVARYSCKIHVHLVAEEYLVIAKFKLRFKNVRDHLG